MATYQCNHCKMRSCGADPKKPECGCEASAKKCDSVRCSGRMIRISEEQLQKEYAKARKDAADRVVESRKDSKLPSWCLRAIRMRAYEDGPAAGQQEIDNIEAGMIYDFEEAMKKEPKTT